jgi:multidrug resistance efflux pump
MHQKPNPKIAIPVVVVLLALVIYALVRAFSPQDTTTITGSGTIEADSSVISPEIGGRVVEIFMNEGDAVEAGEPLFRIDDTLLQGQLSVANASLEFANSAAATAKAAVTTAQANYNLALAAALSESTLLRAQDWQASNPAGYTLPGGSFTPADWIAAARDELQSARDASSQAQTELNEVMAQAVSGDFVAAEKVLLANRARVQTSQDVLTKAGNSNNQDLRDSAQEAYDAAVTDLDDAQARYDELKETEPALAVLDSRAALVLATERVQAAQTRLNALFTGENSFKVQVAKAALDQAAAAGAQSQQAVAQASANLALLTLQIDKLTVKTPLGGTVLSSSIAVGEVLAPGAPAVSVGQLDPLIITVYVPESQIGLIAVGRSASLTVDSYPGIEFLAEVTHIADQAEYTPRNVQTTEGRKTTVFAVKLQVANADGWLKPGMPADVEFLP